MTQEELTMFIYNVVSFANKAHYDTTGYMRYLVKQDLNNATFNEMIVKNSDITDKLKIGGSFTFSCWVYRLLSKLEVADYYILETTKKEDGSSHFVVLFRVENEYRICDLANQVAESEKNRERLSSMALHPKDYSKKERELVLSSLANTNFINQDILEYSKEYNINHLALAMGIEEIRTYGKLQKISFIELLKKRQKDIKSK